MMTIMIMILATTTIVRIVIHRNTRMLALVKHAARDTLRRCLPVPAGSGRAVAAAAAEPFACSSRFGPHVSEEEGGGAARGRGRPLGACLDGCRS